LSYYNGDEVNAFIDGVKYQPKRMYSEEEVLDLLKKSRKKLLYNFDGKPNEYVYSMDELIKLMQILKKK
jgi:hypothetical protein